MELVTTDGNDDNLMTEDISLATVYVRIGPSVVYPICPPISTSYAVYASAIFRYYAWMTAR